MRLGSAMTTARRSLPLAALLIAAATSPVLAQGGGADYPARMFSEKAHDFGVVARGAELKYRVTITNPYKEDVHITNVRTSCGCSAASQPPQTLLHTHESTFIDISMDTRRFTRHKDSSVIVTFDLPYPAEMSIPVKMYVRTDVVLTPGGVNFGAVDIGAPAVQTVDVAYAGRSDWTIRDVRTASKYLTAEVVEVSRAGGTVNYKLTVSLKPDAPAGSLREEVQLVTDDASNPTVPVLVEGRIEADITVTPDNVLLGTLKPGQTTTKNVVIKGRKPFAIDGIQCDGADEAFSMRASVGEKPVHVIPLIFTAPDKPGLYSETFTITIPGRAEPVVFKATGRIVDNATASTP